MGLNISGFISLFHNESEKLDRVKICRNNWALFPEVTTLISVWIWRCKNLFKENNSCPEAESSIPDVIGKKWIRWSLLQRRNCPYQACTWAVRRKGVMEAVAASRARGRKKVDLSATLLSSISGSRLDWVVVSIEEVSCAQLMETCDFICVLARILLKVVDFRNLSLRLPMAAWACQTNVITQNTITDD